MSILLSDRQRGDLHKALADYLFTTGYLKTLEQLKQEVPDVADFQPDVGQRTSGLLAKKWTSVIRMQKKIADLEIKLAQALEENSHHAPPEAGGRRSGADWIPSDGSLKHTLAGHRGRVNAVVFHPVYSSLASGSDDSTIKIWDWETGELERTLKGHTRHVSALDYDSKGENLVSCSQDLSIKIWKVELEYKNVTTLRGHEHSISSVRFLPGDDRVLSSSRDNTLRIWDIASTHCLKVIRPHSDWIRYAAPSADGQSIITCSSDHTAKIVDAMSGETKVELRGHDNVVEAAQLAPLASFPALRELAGLQSPIVTDSASVAAAYAATGSRDKTIKIWDALRGHCLRTLAGHDDWINALVFHPGGQYLLSASDDHSVRVWELKTGRCVRVLAAHDHFVNGMVWGRQPVSISSGGKDVALVNVLATCSIDQTIKIWRP